jgi:choline dehydrogenase
MLPLDKGGVVDATLKVYGTEGLRVVDASGKHNIFRTLTILMILVVIPISLCAHLMGPTYAIAEKAADMIKANATQTRVPSTSSLSSNSRSVSITTTSGSLLIFSSLLAMVTGAVLIP